jgi:chloramphenicol-sensitive protein RarD
MPEGERVTEGRKGVLAMAAASAIWGLSGLYYKALEAVPPVEMLSHRTVWTVIFFGLVLALQRRAGEVRALIHTPRLLAILAVSAAMIAANWLIFIHAVQVGHALEASLGYYIFPLFAVALGYLVLGERFTKLQAVAIGLALGAVLTLGIGLGAPPWTALLLASTFSLYGLIKGQISIGPVVSVFVETLLLAPIALVWLWGMHSGAWTDLGGRAGGIFGDNLGQSALIACAGPLTGGPLILFSYAARRLPYATLGLVQYLNPTLQVLVAVIAFAEPFTRWHAIAFALIWCGLALYSRDGLRAAPAHAPERIRR